MQISISHRLRIELEEGVPHAVEHLMVLPKPGPAQVIEDWKVDIAGIGQAAHFTDAFGNNVLLVSQMRPPTDLVLTIDGRVTTKAGSGVVGRLPEEPQPALFKRPSPLAKAPASLYARYRNAEASGTPILDMLHGLMERVNEHFAAGPRCRRGARRARHGVRTCPCLYWRRAGARHSRPLCVGVLSGRDRCRGLPARLGGSLGGRTGLGRVRCDERSLPQRCACPRCGGVRCSNGLAGACGATAWR